MSESNILKLLQILPFWGTTDQWRNSRGIFADLPGNRVREKGKMEEEGGKL